MGKKFFGVEKFVIALLHVVEYSSYGSLSVTVSWQFPHICEEKWMPHAPFHIVTHMGISSRVRAGGWYRGGRLRPHPLHLINFRGRGSLKIDDFCRIFCAGGQQHTLKLDRLDDKNMISIWILTEFVTTDTQFFMFLFSES